MFDIRYGAPARRCDGVTRRDFLRVGGLTALGIGLSDVLRAQASAGPGRRSQEMNCILIWQSGGNSQLESWDMKPDAPAEIRGEFKPIKTNVPGIEICELFPETAKQADKFAILRSVTHPDAGHLRACHLMLTGYLPAKAVGVGTAYNENPSLGSIMAAERPTAVRGMPSYVVLPKMIPQGHSAYLGARCNPYLIDGDPNAPGFSVRDLKAPTAITTRRLEDRRALLADLDRLARVQGDPTHPVAGMDRYYEQAAAMITSPATQQAFDLDGESAQTRDRYGRNSTGQSMLLARRLVEAGVRCVSVNSGGWDTHKDHFPGIKSLVPPLDRGYAALLADLDQRSLLERTLVVLMGEFGRTPVLNKDAGRDHWPNVWSLTLAGAGIRGGQAIGASDARSQAPAERPIPAEDVHTTILRIMGVDPQKHLIAGNGRPIKILPDGQVVHELFG